MKTPYLIVGGGVSGLLAARILKNSNQSFVGLEKSKQLGGRLAVGHHRLYDEDSLAFAKTQAPDLEWESVEAEPQERNKGEWRASQKEFSHAQSFYLGHTYFRPKESFDRALSTWIDDVKESFELQSVVTQIDADTRTVHCQNGKSFQYETLIWCSPLGVLDKVWRGSKMTLAKLLGKEEEIFGGIHIDWELSENPLEQRNTMIFPFRFKEHRLEALGFLRSGDTQMLQWLLFLEGKLLEDREEMAKCVRTLKREVLKEFPELKDKITSERICHMPSISGEPAAKAESLEILPHVYYIGPQATLNPKSVQNLDCIFSNLRSFELQLKDGGSQGESLDV